MARRPAKVRKTKAEHCTKVVNSEYRKITDLPPELLHMIFEYVKHERWTMKRCAATCPVLREIAVEYLEYRCIGIARNLDHLMAFMQRHRRPPTTVQSLELSGVALDASLVNEMKDLFPNLKDLYLEEDVSCIPPLPYHPPHPAPQPMQLERLVLDSPRHGGWSLCGMVHILSLLAPKILVIDLFLDDGMGFQDKFDPSCLAASPAVEELRVHCSYTPGLRRLTELLDALSRTLSPEHLRSVYLKYDSEADLRALGALLGRIGSNVTSLHLDPNRWSRWTLEERQKWSDPFDDWRMLGIRACKKLETLILSIYAGPRENIKFQRALSYVGAGLLANYASPTLRTIIVDVHGIERPTTLGNRAVLKLQEFNKVVTAARFPNLQQFELRVRVTRELRENPYNCQKCKDAALRALPALRARHLLSVCVGL
ncbi:hypothetical protein L226DRAFT_570537 [Lentinus tigrinus ALCF2SS1-7]|uniref:uncharacterized protein n=1 Tax=Lentinus tigrinus ALCF2SS1-7 TaxID=1328758 RepID=UPI001165D6BD|nr:hypothetical protein L226DRAFT_570537 [Lentinus tigrinus ALCF2SS1-7]